MTKTEMLNANEPSDSRGSELGRAQGRALAEALNHRMRDVAAVGREKRSDEFLVSFAARKAEGLYYPTHGGMVEWREPKNENVHLEICVRDAADGRFIPGLTVWLTVRASNGQPIGTHVQPFLWHPYLSHYGRNWALPYSGEYDLVVHVDPPPFPRHDRENGSRFAAGTICEFSGVQITL